MSEICPIMITEQLLFTLYTLQLPKPKVQPHLRANVGRQIKDGGAITCHVRESPFEPSLTPMKRRANERASAGLPPFKHNSHSTQVLTFATGRKITAVMHAGT